MEHGDGGGCTGNARGQHGNAASVRRDEGKPDGQGPGRERPHQFRLGEPQAQHHRLDGHNELPMSDPSTGHRQPLLLKFLAPDEVQAHLEHDPRLIVPIGTTEQHGAHLPLGCDTIIVERLADDLSARFQVLRAPTIEYGVNAPTVIHYPGSASVRRKTLHRFLNDLVGSWEISGVEQFIILTAHGQDPHQEALSTLRTRQATVRTVDILAVPISPGDAQARTPTHGGEMDTSLLLYIDAELVDLERAQDYQPSESAIRRYHRGQSGAIPKESPGSLGSPSLASADKGERLYRHIFDRIALHVFGLGGGKTVRRNRT